MTKKSGVTVAAVGGMIALTVAVCMLTVPVSVGLAVGVMVFRWLTGA